MLKRNLGRIAQLAKSSLTQQAASFEIISSSQINIFPTQAAASSATNTIAWNLHRWRLYSSQNSGDGPSSDGANSKSINNASGTDATPPGVPTAALSSISLEPDAALDAWGAAMDKGDWESAWDIFESSFPVSGPEFPELEEILAWDPDAEDKAGRREREKAMQEETARARVQKIDDQGRAHGVGKRKTSVARVWIRAGPGHVMVNKRPYDAYFPSLPRRNDVLAPFFITQTLGQFDVMAAVEGGGATGQAQALRHGIARALQNWDPEMRTPLKAAGLLTRDARIVERKKPGKKKARKSFAWVKR